MCYNGGELWKKEEGDKMARQLQSEALRCEWHRGKEGAEDGFALRMEVFTCEQDFPAEIEVDEVDDTAYHLIVRRSGEAVAVCRLFPGEEAGQYVVGRVCVKKSCRGQKLGLLLMEETERKARERGAHSLLLHAQVQVAGFYEAAGFTSQGEAFTEDGWPHVRMVKTW